MKPNTLSWKEAVAIVESWIYNHHTELDLVCKQYGIKLLVIVVLWLLLLINIIIRY
jgi:hypothetical protein